MHGTLAPPRGPSTARDFDEAVAELILQHGPMVLRDARRFTNCAADAEDAYQRSLEIMLTKGPAAAPDDMLAWLRTVTKHEAMAVSRQRQRQVPVDMDAIGANIPSPDGTPDACVDDLFDSEVGAEALSRLKPDQVRCLLFQADGLSYQQIEQATGFSSRKVTRCVIEGRRAFKSSVTAIESGEECERIEPLLHRIVDGDESARAEAQAHLAHCAGCRADLRAYASSPQGVAALFPAALVGVHHVDAAASWDGLSAFWHGLHERLMVHVHGAQQVLELSSAKKIGTVVAVSSALVAGGASIKVAAVNEGSNAERTAEAIGRPPAAEIVPAPIERAERSETAPKASRALPAAPAVAQPDSAAAAPAAPDRPATTTYEPEPAPIADGVGDLAP